ncbi:lipopolysaccharide biosynthesis protein [Spirosoma sp. HMF4905]|uniref:Lipopolysaccharide biosynthesis protein n=1 Tax=Spirosoma arboris TaxID=2682092 RepID=A0A7K1S6V1_9BACT|nr:GNVR domain-containing protein [Spirosoma arboris]MVM29571.1 lipopolysaccharide biosynthesis protein [Spirosoma arboris]
MSGTEIIKKKDNESDEIEIRLSDIVQFLKDSRRSSFLWAFILLIIGIIYAVSKPNQYSAQVTVLPEFQSRDGGFGGLSSLAGLAGIDIGGVGGSSVDAIRPDMYPDVLQNVPFALHILQQPVYSQLSGKETTLQTFFEEQNQQSWLGKLIGSNDKENDKDAQILDPKNNSKALKITKEQEILINLVHQSVSASFDKKTGIITVTAVLSDPVVAATVARLSLEYLTNYMTSYRTEKARNQVRFLTRQVEEAKIRYQKAEYTISNYRDQNRSVYLNTAKIEEQRLQGDFLLTQTVFNDLSKQLEQAKIKVSEEAPVFKILEPARIPLKKSAPKRSLIIVEFTIVGLIIGICIYGIRQFIFNSSH